jgi:hypothetical protein
VGVRIEFEDSRNHIVGGCGGCWCDRFRGSRGCESRSKGEGHQSAMYAIAVVFVFHGFAVLVKGSALASAVVA